MALFLYSLLLLAPTTLVHGAETNGVWNVQRLKQNCGRGGCNQEFYINGELITGNAFPVPGTRTFDSRCTGLGFGNGWAQCQSQIPYTPPGKGGFAKMSAINKTSGSFEVWFTWLNPYSAKPVNETGRMVVESSRSWDVAKCWQMAIVSKEYV